MKKSAPLSKLSDWCSHRVQLALRTLLTRLQDFSGSFFRPSLLILMLLVVVASFVLSAFQSSVFRERTNERTASPQASMLIEARDNTRVIGSQPNKDPIAFQTGPDSAVVGGLSVAFQNVTAGNGGSATSGVTVGFQNSTSGSSNSLGQGISIAFQPGSTPTPSPSPSPNPSPSPERRPLIFIPGIAGSRLVRASDNSERWPGIGTFHDGLTLDREDPDRITDIVSTEVIREISKFGRTLQVYGPLVDRLINDGYSTASNPATLFVFAYDWRKSNDENAIALGNLVDNVRSMHSGSKVDIVAHSMGGILAQRHILEKPNGQHGVAKLITIGTPWLGAPKVINTLETGEFFDGLASWIVLRSTLKRLVEFYPGAHELIPTPRYFELGGQPIKESGWDINGDGNSNQSYTFNQMFQLLNQRHPRSLPATNGLQFHNAIVGQDGWRDGIDGTGVQYFHFYGLRKGADTIGTVVAARRSLCTLSGICIPINTFDVQTTLGDRTVPLLSARRRGNGINLNAVGAILKVFPFTTNSNDDVEHVGLTKNPNVHDALLDALRAPIPSSSQELTSSPNVGSLEPEEPPAQPHHYLKVEGCGSLTITDSHGNTLTPFTGEPSVGIPDVSAYVLGEKSLMAILPLTETYDIVISIGNSPISIDVRVGTDLETSQAIRYTDLNLPAGVKARLHITPQGIEILRADMNGDGTFETPINPTASVTGLAAQDTEPPSVNISGQTQGNHSLINITSLDSGSGVKATKFSLDGTSFQSFTGPFIVNPFMGPSVHAFSDDNVANRSRLVVFYPSLSGNQVDNAQFFVRQHYLDFLNREADSAGLAFWTNEITSCGTDLQCIEIKRINVSAAFFLSIEFQETGYLVYRVYKTAYSDTTSPNVAIPVPIIRLDEFLPDAQRIGLGVRVGIGDWEAQLEANKNAYAREFVVRQRFLTEYPVTMTPAQFVDKLKLNAGGVLSQAERDQLVAELTAAGNMTQGRASVLRKVAEDTDLRQRETNRAFVLMQYYGYMRRNPDDPQDTDFRGWAFWLNKLNQFNGNFIQAEMVKAFIDSIEYRQRFGP